MTGSAEAARYLLRLVDPVTITERGGSLPSREEEWKSRVSAYRCVLVDNASTITAQQSDTLCKVSTGGEAITRAHYTNDTAHVSNLQVPVWLTSIGVGGVLRNDLQSRMVRVELGALGRRLATSDLRAAQDEALPAITAGLLDLTVSVLAGWDAAGTAQQTHRLGDYVRVLHAIDRAHGTNGVARLHEVAAELERDVLDSDPVAQAILLGLTQPSTSHPVEGERTAAMLLHSLGMFARREGLDGPTWPKTAGKLSERLTRVAPALRSQGVGITTRRSNGAKLVKIARLDVTS